MRKILAVAGGVAVGSVLLIIYNWAIAPRVPDKIIFSTPPDANGNTRPLLDVDHVAYLVLLAVAFAPLAMIAGKLPGLPTPVLTK